MSLESSPDILIHVDRLLPQIRRRLDETHDRIRDVVFDTVFADYSIKKVFKNADIQYSTMCGAVVKNILNALQEPYDDINLMAIGNVDLPGFITPLVHGLIKRAHKYAETWIRSQGHLGLGYDISAQGYKPAREMALKNWNRYYGFADYTVESDPQDGSTPEETPSIDENLMSVLSENSTITPGGMHAISVMCTAFNKIAEEKGLKKRYIYPDNSFETWKAIARNSTTKDPGKFNQIRTEQKDRLHLTPEKVHEFYDANDTEGVDDTWYITPVGNPSGTAMSDTQLTATCEAIIARNPNATIILDCVYVRTLETGTAKKLMSGVLSSPEIMKRVVFIESLSKTHGIPGLRLGMFFSSNKELYDSIQNFDMTGYVCHSHELSALMMAFMENPEDTEKAFKELHRFWGRERKGLFNFLIKSGRFTDLFDKDQSHIIPEQIDDPLGLYLFVKIKPGVTRMQIYSQTGCIGVPTKMDTGMYMRFSVGQIKEPTYAKYL